MNKRLALYILIGLVVGAVVGLIFPTFGVDIKPVGTMFINSVEMVIIPLVFSALVVGASGVGSVKTMGRIGLKTILWFEFVTTIIFIVGIILADVLHPGSGVHLAHAKGADIAQAQHSKIDLISMLVNIPPKNIFDALTHSSMLSIVFFATMLGLALSTVKQQYKESVIHVFQGILEATFTLIRWVMYTAPIGVLALAAYSAGKYGISIFIPLLKVIGVAYLGFAIVLLVIFPLIARFILHVPYFKVFGKIADLFLIAFSTTSSEVVMPQLMEFAEEVGVPKSISSFVIPVGLSWNNDGTSMYLSVASLFVAQLAGLHLSLPQQIIMVLVLMVTSKGMAGVPMAGFVVLLTAATAVGLPLQGVALLAAIDRVLDMARSGVNVFGHPLASIAVAKWEKQFDESKLQTFLKNRSSNAQETNVAG